MAIVDDDPRIQELLSAELADLDQPHLSFSSGEALLAELAQCSPKLIFLDVLMPGMGGILDDADSDYTEVEVVSGRSRGKNRSRSKGKGGGGGGSSRKTNKWRNRGGGHKNRNRVAQGWWLIFCALLWAWRIPFITRDKG